MAEEQLQQFLAKIQQLNAFVALSEAQPALRQALRDCNSHHEVVALARQHGFEISRRWGEGVAEPTSTRSLLAGPLPPEGEEFATVLLQGDGWRLERIHSNRATSPAGFWYEQAEHEWVLLLQGSALMAFEGDADLVELNRGDQILIPSGRRHRVVATDAVPGTLWLALFWSGSCAD